MKVGGFLIKMNNKKCRVCKVEKPIDFFYKNKRKKDGIDTICKICASIEGKKHYAKNREYYIKKSFENKELKKINAPIPFST